MLLLAVLVISVLIAPAREGNATTVLLFGDSIIAGYGLEKKQAIPVRVEALLREHDDTIRVINGGVSGDTTSGGRSRLPWTLKKYQPDIVVLALGGNDVLRAISPEVTRKNLETMLAELTQANTVTILSAVQAPSNLGLAYSRAFNAIYPELSEKFRVLNYPFLIKDTFGNASLMQPDGIHPNAAGAALIARDLAAYLQEVIDDSLPAAPNAAQ